jgi:UDP-N-acetylmuramoyl-tripeptide--D-alanyl-D-alanine ligase
LVRGQVDEAAAIMEGRLISGRSETSWEGAALDSRTIRGGELFFALAGDQTDGHRFVSQALDKGASAAVVSQQVEAPADAGVIEVDDTFAALHQLTREIRQRVPRQLVAVTGSVGKTTTKEILATLLGSYFRVARNPGSLNNLYGFPVALLGIPDDTEWMVAEMGMSTPGELGQVGLLGRPDVAVFTNVRPAHLEAFGTLRAIAEAKAELLQGLAADGLVVANRDDPEIVRFLERHAGPVIWFAMESEADYRVADVGLRAAGVGTRFRLLAGEEDQEIELPLHGTYNVENFLAAAACAHTLGVPLASIGAAAARVQGQPRRGVFHRLTRGTVVIDDCYNSNPTALSQALKSAREVEGERHWAILGDMLELGKTAVRLHREMGREAAALGFSPIVGVGELSRELTAGASDAGAATRGFDTANQAAQAVAAELSSGDVVLVKGSRGVGLEVVVEALLHDVEGAD